MLTGLWSLNGHYEVDFQKTLEFTGLTKCLIHNYKPKNSWNLKSASRFMWACGCHFTIEWRVTFLHLYCNQRRRCVTDHVLHYVDLFTLFCNHAMTSIATLMLFIYGTLTRNAWKPKVMTLLFVIEVKRFFLLTTAQNNIFRWCIHKETLNNIYLIIFRFRTCTDHIRAKE